MSQNLSHGPCTHMIEFLSALMGKDACQVFLFFSEKKDDENALQIRFLSEKGIIGDTINCDITRTAHQEMFVKTHFDWFLQQINIYKKYIKAQCTLSAKVRITLRFSKQDSGFVLHLEGKDLKSITRPARATINLQNLKILP